MTVPTAAVPESAEIERESAWMRELETSLAHVIVGQGGLVRGLLIGLVTGGHVLLEGVPGLAKSLAVSAVAQAVHGKFSRLQFTPDLLPSDLVGTEVYNVKDGSFAVRKGPIFANFVLADEVNRAPAKVQSALLEAMQERHVSIGGQTFPLPDPFLVLATQNPLEQEGTYPLPEAQLDRFALKVLVRYPSRAEELEILNRMAKTAAVPPVPRVVDLEAILRARRFVDKIAIDERLREYIVALVFATREPAAAGLPELEHHIQYGGSPRATIWLALCARAHAFISGRGYVTPADIKAVAPEVLRHRVVPTYEAEAEGLDADALVARVLETVPVP
ncbi:MAG: MoxR family ATPase [Planctomycetes bacterium]|nr:MoxR family ATPase [Planctomycetota bacterium]